MKNLFLIPAREGSKRLPGKNIKSLNCKPLIGYTIEAALKASSSNDIVCVSTESDEISRVSEKWGPVIHFKRPKSLASDHSSTQDVIDHAVAHFRKRSVIFDQIVLLQPTSPLRTHEDIENCLDLFSKNNYDLVLSVVKLKCDFINLMFTGKDSGNLIFSKSKLEISDLDEDFYQANGAIYVFRTKIDFGSTRICKYEMPSSRSIDIDTESDWDLVDKLIR